MQLTVKRSQQAASTECWHSSCKTLQAKQHSVLFRTAQVYSNLKICTKQSKGLNQCHTQQGYFSSSTEQLNVCIPHISSRQIPDFPNLCLRILASVPRTTVPSWLAMKWRPSHIQSICYTSKQLLNNSFENPFFEKGKEKKKKMTFLCIKMKMW